MKPGLLQTSRQILTNALIVLGVGLFIAVSVRAIHQVTDRQYTDGKQRAVPSSVSVPIATVHNAAGSTARYATGLTQLVATSPASPEPVSDASPSTPPNFDADHAAAEEAASTGQSDQNDHENKTTSARLSSNQTDNQRLSD